MKIAKFLLPAAPLAACLLIFSPLRGESGQTPSSSNAAADKNGASEKNNAQRCPKNMVWIPPGEFIMGCSPGDDDCMEEEKPPKRVRIAKGFCMDKYEVTQRQYKKAMGVNPSDYVSCGGDCPAKNVNWNDAVAFCQKQGKRLPTEAEWEYSARAGARTRFYWGDEMNGDYAQYGGNSPLHANPVGEKKPNSFGLYDMLGNVWEWTADCHSKEWHNFMPEVDPFNDGSKGGCANRVVRGGSWLYFSKFLRVSNRIGLRPDNLCIPVGLRCAADPK